MGSRCPLDQRGQPNAQPSAVGRAGGYAGRLEVKDEGGHSSDRTQVIEVAGAMTEGSGFFMGDAPGFAVV